MIAAPEAHQVWPRRAGRSVRDLAARTPLRLKLVAALLVLVIVALVTAGVAATTALRGILLQRVDDQLRQAARASVGGPGLPGEGGGRAGRPLSEYYVAYLSPNGTLAWVQTSPFGAEDAPPKLPRLTPAEASALGGSTFTLSAQGGGAQWRAIALPAANGSVVVSLSLAGVQRTVHQLALLQLAIGGGVVVLLAGVAYVVVRRTLRALTEVEVTAAAIAAGDLSRRVPAADPRTEVGRLSAALNGMLGQIERAFHVQLASETAARRSEWQMRRFVADASHELRTPLTSIRGFAELYRQGAAEDPEDLARVMRRIEDEAARMGLLVEDLLLLARLDSQRPLERTLVDLLTLANDAAHDARVVAPDRPITVEVREATTTPPVVWGDEARLRQVVGNLMSNALSHTPAGTAVAVRVGTEAGNGRTYALLEVADRGPGLDPADAERVFERFFRADQSRHRGSGGSGLGLSIADGLTTAHGGRMELRTRAGGGATFRVLLPLADGGQDAVLGSGAAPVATPVSGGG